MNFFDSIPEKNELNVLRKELRKLHKKTYSKFLRQKK